MFKFLFPTQHRARAHFYQCRDLPDGKILPEKLKCPSDLDLGSPQTAMESLAMPHPCLFARSAPEAMGSAIVHRDILFLAMGTVHKRFKKSPTELELRGALWFLN